MEGGPMDNGEVEEGVDPAWLVSVGLVGLVRECSPWTELRSGW